MTPMIVEHPLLQHKLSILRNKQTGTKEFRDLVGEIATLLCYEATRDLPLEEVEIETPITMAKTKVLAGRKLALVPILRAGMGMLDGMLTLLPAAKVGFIGLYRDEQTLQPVEYFCKLPQDIAERDVLVLDSMSLWRTAITNSNPIASRYPPPCISAILLHAPFASCRATLFLCSAMARATIKATTTSKTTLASGIAFWNKFQLLGTQLKRIAIIPPFALIAPPPVMDKYPFNPPVTASNK